MQADILPELSKWSRPAACTCSDVPAALQAKRKDSHSIACRRTDVDMFCKDCQVVQDECEGVPWKTEQKKREDKDEKKKTVMKNQTKTYQTKNDDRTRRSWKPGWPECRTVRARWRIRKCPICKSESNRAAEKKMSLPAAHLYAYQVYLDTKILPSHFPSRRGPFSQLRTLPRKNRANASVGQKIWREPRISSLFVWRNKRWRPCRLRFSGCSCAGLPIFQLRIASMSWQS